MEGHLSKRDWDVIDVSYPSETRTVARELVRALHYSKSCTPVFAYVHALVLREAPDILLGVAWWKAPMAQTAKSVAKHCKVHKNKVLDLSRVVVDPRVPTNGASFMIGRAVRMIKRDGRFDALVSFADEFEGHTGQIYKATNWEYVGRTKGEPVWIDPRTGARVSRKQGRKTRRVAEMEALGFERVGVSHMHKFVQCLRKR